VTVVVSPDRTETVNACVPPITKFGNVEGLNTGSFANLAEGAAIVTALEANEKELSPTILVAFTLTV
jgi:hypothetical protein